jgi:SAM-dependent methyltransferase
MWDNASTEWQAAGEDWSSWWGGSEAQWFGSIYPRLHRFLPASRILEIAPGFGRWTRFLLDTCESYVGIDLSEQAIQACRKRFRDIPHAKFIQNDGYSLGAVGEQSCDFIFSFDSLVHAELDVMERYLPQLVGKLAGSGVAFLHHSNFADVPKGAPNPHSRAVSVSANRVAHIVRNCGGTVLIQEILNWGGPEPIDAFTVFGRADSFSQETITPITNLRWVDEMNIIREVQSNYSKALTDSGHLTRPPKDHRTLFLRAWQRLRQVFP